MNSGTFGEVIRFLKSCNKEAVCLKYPPDYLNGLNCSPGRHPGVAISPHSAGKVLAVTPDGDEGINPLFINREAIENPDFNRQFHPEGGHRWWPLPEGQKEWSLYFPAGTTDFSIENWFVPSSFDKISFHVLPQKQAGRVELWSPVKLSNVKGSLFEIIVSLDYLIRECPVQLISAVKQHEVFHAGYTQKIRFTNNGKEQINNKTGMIAPWSLNMLKSSDNSWIILPVKKGCVNKTVDYCMSGKNSDEPVSSDRFLKRDNYGLLRADGRFRSKLGLRPDISTGYIASIDIDNGLLCVMHVPVFPGKKYIDNTWAPESRFGGTVIDCYNDSGDIAGGGLSSMFELEGVSPVEDFGPGEQIEFNVTVHFFQLAGKDNIALLTSILKDITGVDLGCETYRD